MRGATTPEYVSVRSVRAGGTIMALTGRTCTRATCCSPQAASAKGSTRKTQVGRLRITNDVFSFLSDFRRMMLAFLKETTLSGQTKETPRFQPASPSQDRCGTEPRRQ